MNHRGTRMTLAASFDLRRIAAIGAIYYLIMDIAIHWGLLRHLRDRIPANRAVLLTAIAPDVVVLGAFLWIKASTEALSLYVSGAGVAAIVVSERLFMRSHTNTDGTMDM